MKTGRLEAFSDGVIAILITIMVLELKVPRGADLQALEPLCPVLFCYLISFVYLGIYWNNHHHMLHAAERVNGVVLWANLHLLFWLSLIPFVTSWVGEYHNEAWPTALYGVVLTCAGGAFTLLARMLVRAQHGPSTLALAIGDDPKGLISMALYAAAVGLAFVNPKISDVIYVMVALMWIIPNRSIEKRVSA